MNTEEVNFSMNSKKPADLDRNDNFYIDKTKLNMITISQKFPIWFDLLQTLLDPFLANFIAVHLS